MDRIKVIERKLAKKSLKLSTMKDDLLQISENNPDSFDQYLNEIMKNLNSNDTEIIRYSTNAIMNISSIRKFRKKLIKLDGLANKLVK